MILHIFYPAVGNDNHGDAEDNWSNQIMIKCLSWLQQAAGDCC